MSCRTAWVNGRKSACKSYVSSLSSSAKLSPRTQIGRIQSYSKRILLNTPRIQDSRFKVPGRTLPCTLNLGSEAYSTEYVLNTFEYGTLRFDHCILYFEPVVVLWIVVVLCSIDTTDFARALRDLTPVLLCEVTYHNALYVLDSFRKHFPYHTAVIVVIHPVSSVLLFTIRLAQQFPSSGSNKLGTLNFILIDLKIIPFRQVQKS